MFASLLGILWMACSPVEPEGVDSGWAGTCLGGDSGETWPKGELADWQIEGEVVSDEPLSGELSGALNNCGGPVSRILTVLDGEGVTYQMGYGIQDSAGGDMTDPLAVTPGAQVSLTYRAVRSFGDASGFVLTDKVGVVAAMEVGTWGGALEDGDVPGLAVEQGDTVLSESNDCGDLEHYETRFMGDDEVALNPGEEGLFSLGSQTLNARAVAYYEYVGQMSCMDTGGAWIWAIWR